MYYESVKYPTFRTILKAVQHQLCEEGVSQYYKFLAKLAEQSFKPEQFAPNQHITDRMYDVVFHNDDWAGFAKDNGWVKRTKEFKPCTITIECLNDLKLLWLITLANDDDDAFNEALAKAKEEIIGDEDKALFADTKAGSDGIFDQLDEEMDKYM